MVYNIIIYLLAFTSMVCYGYVREFSSPIADLGKQGAIFKTGPEETLTIMFIDGGTSKLDTSYSFGLGETKREIHLRCHEYVKKGDNELTQYRANYQVKKTGVEDEEIEIDEFIVTSCDEVKLKRNILFYTTEANKYTVNFRVTSSNPKNACFQRSIQVEEKEFSSITRSAPQPIDCRKVNILKESEGLVVPGSWMPIGKLDDVYVPDGATKYDLLGNGKCEDCFVACKWTTSDKGSFGVVDVVIRGIPVDRLYSTSCRQYSLQTSIWLHGVKDWYGSGANKRSTPLTLIYLNYLFPDGACRRRQIDLDAQAVENDPFLKRVTLQRWGFFDVTCVKMKSKGLVRFLLHKTRVATVFSR